MKAFSACLLAMKELGALPLTGSGRVRDCRQGHRVLQQSVEQVFLRSNMGKSWVVCECISDVGQSIVQGQAYIPEGFRELHAPILFSNGPGERLQGLLLLLLQVPQLLLQCLL